MTFPNAAYSMDPLVKSEKPAIITGRKWDAKYAVEMAESSLKMKEIISSVANGRLVWFGFFV